MSTPVTAHAASGQTLADPAVATGRVEHLGSLREPQQPVNQLDLGVAARLQHLVVEPEVVLVEQIASDELLGHARYR
jgi:hypothetical protein